MTKLDSVLFHEMVDMRGFRDGITGLGPADPVTIEVDDARTTLTVTVTKGSIEGTQYLVPWVRVQTGKIPPKPPAKTEPPKK